MFPSHSGYWELPSSGPFDDPHEWLALVLGAVDQALDTPSVWRDEDVDTALSYMSDLRYLLQLAMGCYAPIGDENMVFPVGMIGLFATSSPPVKWLACDGSAVSRATYSVLFTAIGVAFGAGNGSTTFNLPDLRGRSAVGAGQGSGLTDRALAASGGGETHQLTTNELASHSHGVTAVHGSVTDQGQGVGYYQNIYTYTSPYSTAQSTNSVGSNAAHNNMQPFLVLGFAIYADV